MVYVNILRFSHKKINIEIKLKNMLHFIKCLTMQWNPDVSKYLYTPGKIYLQITHPIILTQEKPICVRFHSNLYEIKIKGTCFKLNVKFNDVFILHEIKQTQSEIKIQYMQNMKIYFKLT